MKKFLLLLILIISIVFAKAQTFSGQWKGSFVDKRVSAYSFGGEESDYVLEIEVEGENVSGYSYTYFTTDGIKYYTICKIKGKLYPKRKYIEITETERTKTNIPQNITNSFQLHKLTWYKKGADEVLEGNWEPAPGQDRNKTGYGTTMLKKRQLTEISSLAKKRNSVSSIRERLNPKDAKTNKETPKATVYNKYKGVLETKPLKTKKPEIYATSISKNKFIPQKIKPVTTPTIISKKEDKKNELKQIIKPLTPPKIFLPGFENRTSNLINTIFTENETIKVELYDNGDIDGDSVSIFYNNELLVSHKKLTSQPLQLTLPVKNYTENELVMYADNLGTIPPNTALLIVTDGKKRYEVRITSDLEKSGTIKFVHLKKE